MFTSSIAVFGPPPSGPLPDPTPDDVALHPTTMYGVDEGLRRAAVRATTASATASIAAACGSPA